MYSNMFNIYTQDYHWVPGMDWWICNNISTWNKGCNYLSMSKFQHLRYAVINWFIHAIRSVHCVFGIRFWKLFLFFLIIILLKSIPNGHINSVRLGGAYMHWGTLSPLDQIMACCLLGAEPVSKPMVKYCQWDPKRHTCISTDVFV